MSKQKHDQGRRKRARQAEALKAARTATLRHFNGEKRARALVRANKAPARILELPLWETSEPHQTRNEEVPPMSWIS